ncbi:MAG: hypothetical protein LBT21_02350 [Oscillospiraceae bacterium]|nr:hypothetical protein [Oscillospiraceae bacterium]
MSSVTKKVFQCICAALLVLALTWITVGESPLSAPAELLYSPDSSTGAPAPSGITDPTIPQPGGSTIPTANKTQAPAPTGGVPQTTAAPRPGNTSPKVTNAPSASILPSSATKAEAVKLYLAAIAKAETASGFTAQKSETANMNIHTGERIKVLTMDFGVDEFFHDFVGTLRSSNYQYGGGTWALVSQRSTENLLTNKTESHSYAEYGSKSAVAYNDAKYWNLSPATGSGLSTASLTALLRQGDVLKMARSSAPASFLPPAAFAASDVLAYNYTKTSGGATLSITLNASAIANAMIMPDTNAIRTQPYVYDAGIAKVKLSFSAVNLKWQSPHIEVTLNAQGLPTSIKQTAAMGDGSSCTMSVNSSIKDLENLNSTITGSYSVSWTLGNWGKVGTPGRPW